MSGSVLIVGAGPAGLAVAAALRAERVPFRLVDKSGLFGGAYREMYGSITLSSPTALDGLPGFPLRTPGEYPRADEYLAYLEAYAAHHGLEVERATVLDIARTPGGFAARLEGDGAAFAAPAVVVATGMWSFPRLPVLAGSCGVPVLHARHWRGPAASPARRMIIVGGGASAVEIAEEAAASGVAVVIAARTPPRLVRSRFLGRDVHSFVGLLERLPTWLARTYCETCPTLPATDREFSALRKTGAIRVRAAIERVDNRTFIFSDGGREDADLLVLATGYTFATPFLPSEVARARAGHVRAARGESVSWPGLFVLGAPCSTGLDSEFLRGMARDAPVVARAIATRLRAQESGLASGRGSRNLN